MSVYDPFQLYTHHQKKSHDGQIIRKKLTPPPNYAISEEMVKQAQEILIKAGIRGFNSLANKRLFIFKQYPYIFQDNLDIGNAETTVTFSFSSFWDAIKADFAPIYNTVLPISVKQISFEVYLNSVIFGPYSTSNGSYNVQYGFAFDGYSTPSSSTYSSYLSSSHFYISLSSINTSQFLIEIDGQGQSDSGGFVNKNTETSHPYLTYVLNQSPAILTVLKNSDYTVFNPDLIQTIFKHPGNGILTISKVIYSVTVALAVEYK